MKKTIPILAVSAAVILCIGGGFAYFAFKNDGGLSAVKKIFIEEGKDDKVKMPPAKEDVSAPIVKIALFKNGSGIITRELAKRDWSKPVDLAENIVPQHGTLWFDTPGVTLTRTTRPLKKEPEPEQEPDPSSFIPEYSTLGELYAGQNVEITLEDGRKITGKLPGPKKKTEEANASDPYSSNGSYYDSYYLNSSSSIMYSYLTVAKPDGSFATVPVSAVRSISAKSLGPRPEQRRVRQRPAVIPQAETPMEQVQRVAAPADCADPIRMSYLGKGITWSPSYRMILLDQTKLNISMATTITNELEDIKDAEFDLISGFPNIAFVNVTSPVAKSVPLQSFLQNLDHPDKQYSYDGVMSQLVTQNAYFANDSGFSFSIAPNSANDSVFSFSIAPNSANDNIQYRPIGKLSLKKGDTIVLPLSSKSADYERIVIWSVANNRNDSSYAAEILWDAVRFKNPFDFALTTAPYQVEQDGKMLGQSIGSWFNPGENAVLKITHSLTVSGRIVEYESGERDRKVIFWNHTYRNPEVTAVLTAVNRQAQPVKLLIDSSFAGELVKADGEPRKVQLDENSGINQRWKLFWEVTIEPGKELTLNYTYSTLR